MKEVYPQWKLKNLNSKFLSSPYPSPSPLHLLQDQESAFVSAFYPPPQYSERGGDKIDKNPDSGSKNSENLLDKI